MKIEEFTLFGVLFSKGCKCLVRCSKRLEIFSKYPFVSNWLPKSVKWVRLCFIQAHQSSGTTSYFWKLSYFYEIWVWANTRGSGVMSLLVNLRMSRSLHPSTPLVPLYTHPPIQCRWRWERTRNQRSSLTWESVPHLPFHSFVAHHRKLPSREGGVATLLCLCYLT